MKTAEDGIFSFEIICAAKNFLHIPQPLYVQRLNDDSATRLKRTPEQDLIFRAKTLLNSADCLEKFMSGIKIFNESPNLRLRVLMFFLEVQLGEMQNSLLNLTPAAVYKVFLREFSKSKALNPALLSILLVMLNIRRNELSK